jgi:hypothetical protein
VGCEVGLKDKKVKVLEKFKRKEMQNIVMGKESIFVR